MEQIECSETSAFNNQTPGKYPKDYTQDINDLPIISNNAILVLYTDDTSIIITSHSNMEFSTKVNTAFTDINELVLKL
jgi:hypothetical protein